MLHLAQQGVLPGAAAVPAAARRHDVEVPRRCTRSATAWSREPGMELLVHTQPGGGSRAASTRSTTAPQVHTDMWKTQGLKQALDQHGFDAAFGGARRDEEKSRAKERIFSFRTRPAPLGPEEPAARAVAPLQRPQAPGRERSASSRCRTGPSSTSGSTSTSRRSRSCRSTSRRAPGGRARRHADHGRRRAHAARARRGADAMKMVRFRTLGCYPLTGAIESNADTLPAIIQEMLLTRTSERQGRLIDHDAVGLDGEEEAGGLLLMDRRVRVSDLLRPTSSSYLASARARRACCASSPAAASTTARAR